LWFGVVAPHRGPLATMPAPARRALLARHWPHLVAATWEELCRDALPRLGNWYPGARWWRGNEPEWDVVAESLGRRRLLLGEVNLQATQRDPDRFPLRPLPPFAEGRAVVRALFTRAPRRLRVKGALVFGARDVFTR